MKRSGGRSSRPLGHLQIDNLENMVRENESDVEELKVIWAELHHRKSPRSSALKDLVTRMLHERQKTFRLFDS